MLSEDEVSLIYKKVEKSEEKNLEEVTTRWIYGLQRGVWGYFIKSYYK